MIKIFNIYILLLFFSIINCEVWYPEVTGFNTKDGKNVYAGSKGVEITYFYLKGNNHCYRAHILNGGWTQEACNGRLVGNGNPIDAISIYGVNSYRVRYANYKNGNWESHAHKYDINDYQDGYAGTFGHTINAIAINGGSNGYAVAYGQESSNPENTVKRVVGNLFGVYYNYKYQEEITIIDYPKIKITVTLEKNYSFKYKGALNIVIKNHEITDINLGNLDINLFEELDKIMNVKSKIDLIKMSFSKGVANGRVAISFYFLEKKIEIKCGTKVDSNNNSFNGGFTMKIYLKDDFNQTGGQLLAVSEVFLKRFGQAGNFVLDGLRLIVNNAIAIMKGVFDYLANNAYYLISSFLGIILAFVFKVAL